MDDPTMSFVTYLKTKLRLSELLVSLVLHSLVMQIQSTNNDDIIYSIKVGIMVLFHGKKRIEGYLDRQRHG